MKDGPRSVVTKQGDAKDVGLVEKESGIRRRTRTRWSICNLKITVLEIAPGRVKLGFEGGGEVPVHRWEVWQQLLAAEECLMAPEPLVAAADRSTAHAEV